MRVTAAEGAAAERGPARRAPLFPVGGRSRGGGVPGVPPTGGTDASRGPPPAGLRFRPSATLGGPARRPAGGQPAAAGAVLHGPAACAPAPSSAAESANWVRYSSS
ncbi:hypothetical protein GCM10009605_33150 [Nocardiopsis composta]